MKKCLAIALACLLSTQSTWAIPIWVADRMSTDDQNRYSEALTQSLEAACQEDPVTYAKVKQFFKMHHRGDSADELLKPIGWDQVTENIAYARLADLQRFAQDPEAPRLELEDVVFATLLKNGIAIPRNAWRPPVDFRRQDPLKPVATMEYALQQVEYAKQMVASADEENAATKQQNQGWTDTDTAVAFFGALALIIAAASNNDTTPSNAQTGQRRNGGGDWAGFTNCMMGANTGPQISSCVARFPHW